MIVAELTVIPVGKGSSMEDTLERVEDALQGLGLDYEVGALGTIIQAEEMAEVLEAVDEVHAVVVEHVPRVVIELRVDHRVDKEETKESLATLEA